jgi:lauroyl/myristoyl acyltransferase
MTQQIACFFEESIREHPQDWHMLQRVFTADLDPERLAAAQRRAAARDTTAMAGDG